MTKKMHDKVTIYIQSPSL